MLKPEPVINFSGNVLLFIHTQLICMPSAFGLQFKYQQDFFLKKAHYFEESNVTHFYWLSTEPDEKKRRHHFIFQILFEI